MRDVATGGAKFFYAGLFKLVSDQDFHSVSFVLPQSYASQAL